LSIHVITWVLEHSDERLGRRLVLLVLADHAKKDGTSAWPSIDTIAHEARLSRAQVIRCLNELKEANAIIPRGSTRSGTNVYDVVMGGSHIATARGRKSGVKGSQDATRTVLKATVPTSLAAAPQNGHRARNEIWDALTHMFGEPATPSATKGRGKVCSELKAAGASPDEIMARGKNWPAHFDGATLTEHALVKHWHTLARKPLRRVR